MKKIFLTILIFGLCSTLLATQITIAWTETGKKVELYSDGTWKYVEVPTEEDWRNYVVFLNFKADYVPQDILSGRAWNEVRLFFQFMNATSKTITGLIYEVKYLDAFNDIVFTRTYKHNIIIKPTKSTSMDWYWYYREIDDPYRRLKNAAEAGTLHVLLRMQKIAFEGGTIIEFKDGPWTRPKWKKH